MDGAEPRPGRFRLASHPPRPPEAVARAAQHVWLVVGFTFVWLHFSYVRPHLRHLDWQIYTLYFVAVAGIACRYLTGIRYGHTRWHRVIFDTLTIVFISLGVNVTGGIYSDLWLVYFIFVIAETLAASARGFLISDAAAVVSYVIATWPREVTSGYFEIVGTRMLFLILVSSIARTMASEERRRVADLGALREELSASEERRRLARDLHDGLGHVLTRVILSLEVARRQNERDPAGATEQMRRQTDALRGAMDEMRQIVATLRTDTSGFDLRASLRALAEETEAEGTLRIELALPDGPLPLSSHQQYHLSRVLQEAITNCLRHSGSPVVRVEVAVRDEPLLGSHVVASVTDEGRGFDVEAARARGTNGLRGMEERLAPYGGSLRVESSAAGTRVTAEIPVPRSGGN